MSIRLSTTASILAAAALLALGGCASSVKLDEPKSAPIVEAPVNGAGSGANAGGVASSTVAPVVTAGAQNSAAEADAALAALATVILFDYDSYVVKPEYNGTLEGYAKVLNNHKSRRFTVEGHTDARGSREYNLALGQKRAEATVKALGLLGVSAEQLEAVSFGKERPAVEGGTEEAFAKNRRAEFKKR